MKKPIIILLFLFTGCSTHNVAIDDGNSDIYLEVLEIKPTNRGVGFCWVAHNKR